MNRLSSFTILGFLALLLVACDYEPVFQQGASIPNDSWNKNNIIKVEFPVTDTIKYHDIYINIRNLNSYPYSNLYLFVDVNAPNGDSMTDTLEYRLADDYGTWLGKKSSRIWDCKLPFRGMVKFAQEGVYTFSIQHGMRDDELEGISDVGLTIELTPDEYSSSAANG